MTWNHEQHWRLFEYRVPRLHVLITLQAVFNQIPILDSVGYLVLELCLASFIPLCKGITSHQLLSLLAVCLWCVSGVSYCALCCLFLLCFIDVCLLSHSVVSFCNLFGISAASFARACIIRCE